MLISGRGSNLQALNAAFADPAYTPEISLVLSNKAGAGGLAHAETAGIATRVIPHDDFPDRETFDREVSAALDAAGVELVCLAGFMRLVSSWFVETWHDRIINIHPSLLPAFKGIDAHEQALAAGVRVSGCTVHIVRAEMDAGPILVQAAVPVLPDDDVASLSARILVREHECYPLAVRLIAEGRVRIEGDRAVVDGPADGNGALTNPPPTGV